MATITKRGDSYKITVSCGYDATGKQIRRHTTYRPDPGLTSKQIEKELNRVAVKFEEQCTGYGYIAANIKFQAFAEQWFEEYAAARLKERTKHRYQQLAVRTYQAIGHIRLDKLTPRHIQIFINNLGREGLNQRTGGKLSPKTIKHYHAFISTVLDYAVKMGMLPDNPCKRVILPAMEQAERDCFTLEETQRFLDLLQQEPLKYQAFFTLAIYGGFRRAELLGLEWKDIDFDTGLINIRRTSLYTKDKGIYTDTPKTKGSTRLLKLPQDVINILERYRSEWDTNRINIGDRWHETDRLFITWDGQPMNGSTPLTWLTRFCDRTGQRRVNIHSFRHLNASLLINSGIDVKTVSSALGHSQVSTTLNIYAHSFAEAQARASDAVASALNLHLQNREKSKENL